MVMESSGDEYEPFQVTEEDQFAERFPQRRRRRQTREDRIYGMWAQHDSDDEDGRGPKDFTRPVNFVLSEKRLNDNEEEEEGDVDSDLDDEALDRETVRIMEERQQRKLEKGGEKAGVGRFRHASLESNKKLKMFNETSRSSSAAMASKPAKMTRRTEVMDTKFGSWEKHTTGFGSKMLQKMGWKHGQGLGSSGEGIVNPVKATRHTEFGRGLVNIHNQSSLGRSVIVEGVDEEDEGEQQQFEEQLQQWRKTESSDKHKPKYIYKTVEELKHSGKRGLPRSSKGRTSVKVIDLTGPQKRVLSSYEEIHDRHSRPDEARPSSSRDLQQKMFLHELQDNIQLLVERTENEILHNDRTLQHNRDLVVNLSHEREELRSEVEAEEKMTERLTEILNIVEICEQQLVSHHGSPLSLQECEELVSSLQEKYPAEYKTYDLSSVAVAIVFPMIKAFLQGWEMLKSPQFPLGVFSTWRRLLRERENTHTIPSTDNMDPYDRLVWDCWMPKFRSTISSWSPRICNPVIDLLECWMPLLPSWVMDNILDQMVLPRLHKEVETWDPTTDTMPIHAWVHPWLPLMEQRLEILYAPIRYKLATALNNWHPSDSSAHKILEPWLKVFSPETMEAFLARTIVPKLAYCLQSLPITPHQQEIAPFEWVMVWRDMIPAHHYASILEQHFFPKWLQVLSAWLSSRPNFDEVTRWYTGWKGMLDREVLGEPSVKRHFNQALDMMNHAVAGTFQPGARENIAYFTSTERRKTAEVTSVSNQRSWNTSLKNAVSAPASLSFKDVVERMAEDNGILFMPVPGQKRYEGKALYNFGSATMYIDRGVAFVMKGGQWAPVSLDELLRLA